MKHPSIAAHKGGCRCDKCVARVPHGKWGGYCNWGCRCAECAKAAADTMRAQNYGISPEEFMRFWEAQDGKCAICGDALKDDRTTVVEHCHDCNAIRGLAHQKCNHGVGMFGDDPEKLRRAAAHLEKHRC